MSDKNKTIYVCTKCGAQSLKWSGRCLECGAWGTFREDLIDSLHQKNTTVKAMPGETLSLHDIKNFEGKRVSTNISECDRVLGGGLVPGSLVLLGGEPGIGKSTLALQIASQTQKSLYVSGEENAGQVKTRASRLNINCEKIQFMSETNIEKIIATALQIKPNLLIIDSVQTVYSTDAENETGSLNQIRASATKLLQMAKTHDIAVIITGHITKDGQLAGPKTLEHLVDTVIYLEQKKNNDFRVMRAVKNRFGSTDEIGLFEMTAQGFQELKNPSGIFLDEMQNVNGTAVSCVMEGTRPFLLEVQALATKTAFGYPQRKASGFDLNRLQILIAVLTKRAKLNLSNQDVHVNIVGGLKINDPALDLAICAAIISSLSNQTIDKNTIILGEVGLGGEVRKINKLTVRLNEAKNLGFTRAIAPMTDIKNGLFLTKISNVAELTNLLIKNK